jgi:hypothetical protein
VPSVGAASSSSSSSRWTQQRWDFLERKKNDVTVDGGFCDLLCASLCCYAFAVLLPMASFGCQSHSQTRGPLLAAMSSYSLPMNSLRGYVWMICWLRYCLCKQAKKLTKNLTGAKISGILKDWNSLNTIRADCLKGEQKSIFFHFRCSKAGTQLPTSTCFHIFLVHEFTKTEALL